MSIAKVEPIPSGPPQRFAPNIRLMWNRTSSPVRKVAGPRLGPSVPALLMGVTLIGVAGAGFSIAGAQSNHLLALVPGSGCNIKGNINVETGERIYHVPGQQYHRQTVISLRHGERWFCSEAEARKAGWRRSRV